MLYKAVLTFESVDEILKCGHSNESYWAVLFCGAVYVVQGGSNCWGCGWYPEVWPFKLKLLSSTFQWCCLFCSMYKVVLTWMNYLSVWCFCFQIFCKMIFFSSLNWLFSYYNQLATWVKVIKNRLPIQCKFILVTFCPCNIALSALQHRY